MIVDWHCRTCGAEGCTALPIKDILAAYEKGREHFLTTLMGMIDHACKETDIVGYPLDDIKPDIGVKLRMEDK